MMGSGRFGRSADSSAAESNGGKTAEMQLRLQSQQEELGRMQQEQAKLREELASQKVRSVLPFVTASQPIQTEV